MKRNKKKDKITFLLLLLLGISIGFAALATTLKINGTANISKNTWNVYWDNIDNQDGVTPTTSEIVNEDDTHKKNIVNFEVTFEKPGDYYEFTVDAVNAGTIDAEILSIEKKFDDTVISQENPLPSYLKYEVTYEDGSEIKVGDKLAKRTDASTFTRKTYKIRVEYDRDAVTNSDINNQVGDVTHTFDFKVEYGQSIFSDSDGDIAAIIEEIEADPDSHRNPEQDVRNTDIGLDEDGNVINLDWWTLYGESYEEGSDLPYTRDYTLRYEHTYEGGFVLKDDEIVLGMYKGSTPVLGYTNSGVNTIATASENIINGEMIAPIPAYIMLSETGKFYPVTEIIYAFGDYNWSYHQDLVKMTKLPKIPNTVTTIGENAFWELNNLVDVEIPKHIKRIEYGAFSNAFSYNSNDNKLSFEEGSQLEYIGVSSFSANYLEGDLVLPPKVEYIGSSAFKDVNLTSVSFPTSAEYFDDTHGTDASFAQGVTIIRY